MPDIPVQRAETYYLPPTPLAPDAWALVPPAARCTRWYEVKQQRRIELPDGLLLGHITYARIDAGRWVADCPCGSAQVVTPTDPRLGCPECGAAWFPLTFPDDVAAAEAAVAELLPAERFWWHPDDVAWNRPPAGEAPADEPTQPEAAPFREATT